MAAAQVEILQETEQKAGLKTELEEAATVQLEPETVQEEAAKVQEEQEATSGNIQEEKGGACDDDHTDEELKS